jgi:pyruvate dehydrogenase E1 component
VAATIPNCKAWDPAIAGEMAVIVDAGAREMLVEQQDVFYYVTLMNENYAQPEVPEAAHDDILRGCWRYEGWKADAATPPAGAPAVTLLGSGAILTEVVKAARQLAEEGIAAEVFSVTSWSELARDGQACERRALAGEDGAEPFVARRLAASAGPIIAATDYVRAVPESIRAFLPAGRRYLTLGTDGFGRSDTRSALREFFQVDAASIVRSARAALK